MTYIPIVYSFRMINLRGCSSRLLIKSSLSCKTWFSALTGIKLIQMQLPVVSEWRMMTSLKCMKNQVVEVNLSFKLLEFSSASASSSPPPRNFFLCLEIFSFYFLFILEAMYKRVERCIFP